MKDWKKFGLTVFQFIALGFVLSVSAVLFSKTNGNLNKFLIICADAILYILWGIWHHHYNDRLDKYILIEYGMVSLLLVLLAALGLGIIRFI